MMLSLENSPKRLASRIEKDYAGLIDYVLLDRSQGAGEPLDPHFLYDFIKEITERVDVGIGVAGGLSATTLRTSLEPLAGFASILSIDAEGKLRTEEDHLDIDQTAAYVKEAYDFFGNKEQGSVAA